MAPSDSPAIPTPHVEEDCRGILRVLSDGSILRSPNPTHHPPLSRGWCCPRRLEGRPVLLLRPPPSPVQASKSPPGPATKFPVFYYFHGGGYCLGARDWPASTTAAFAPEHRLPAAALLWLRSQAGAADPWLAELADLGRVFVSG
ncbi:unnamed protein product [Musa acuminata subsp. malaccensis]|uniref:(wild Malaysian banana) hypothetical protein n=1 Tax=Musa acuminata subsp. malaccensis TaxID=214687 RepID=A0A804K8X6_MUSAM|nr:unnamed protein product [Musa acuminata subsp. malaccensis]